MHVLGLNIGHNATACLLKDGKIISCVSEERFSRIKNHSGIPFRAIKWLFDENKISMKEIDLVILDDHYTIEKDSDFGKKYLESYTKKSFAKKVLSSLGYNYPRMFKFYSSLKPNRKKENLPNLIKEIAGILRISEDKIKIIGHHVAHAFAPCFNLASNKKNEKTLIFTLDGEGMGICASVNVFDGKNLKVISKSRKDASLGYLYSAVTTYLGMKPLEHEFKVMGLAPYAKEHNVDKIYGKFKELILIDNNLRFKSKFSMPFADYFLFEEMKFKRFDVIAGAVQKLVEELVCEWVRKGIKKTGIKNVAFSGGVFMNVKALMKISEIPEIKKMFIMPSCGDESNAIGCCFYGYKLLCKKKNAEFNPAPLADLYLGPEYSNDYVANLIKEKKLGERYKIKKIKNINLEIAKLLAKGEIVARCSGKSEWGARALGNRSILSNPFNKDTIRVLNETIKDRDFWMPFTPSILDSDEKKYIKNPKKIFLPYMVITFNSTELARKHLPAAMHPYDFTIRPQIVTKVYNKDYYEIIEMFRKMTGIGGILNTSFNLHGEPNVLTPEDALHTVENSELKFLAIENYLFEKKPKND